LIHFCVRRSRQGTTRGTSRTTTIGVHLTGVCLMSLYLTGVHLMGVYLINMHLTGVYLMGVHLIDVYFMDVYMFPNPKKALGNLQIPHLTNGGRFVEI
jgi:hypothetical protein